jgi:glycosyltransferase involved in cell wall biosynthesis
MKICYLADASSVHTTRWANHFSSRGYDVEIVSYRRPRDLSPLVSTHIIEKNWPLGLDRFISVPQVRDILKQSKPDIVHAHYASSYGTLGRLCGFHPYVLSVWGSDVYDFPRRSGVHRVLIEKNLAFADRICSTSQIMSVETQRYCNTPITVTPFGVDCDRFFPVQPGNQREKEFIVGTVKALEHTYGVEYLIRSFALLTKKYGGQKKLRLAIAGDGSLRKPLARLVSELGLMGRVSFLGSIPHTQVPQLLNTFSVFCALSLRESFGVAVLEASACEVPVVVTNVGGLPEVVQDEVTGLVVSPKNISATTTAISNLIENESLRRALGTAGRKFVLENYEWSENATRMERVYESVLRVR